MALKGSITMAVLCGWDIIGAESALLMLPETLNKEFLLIKKIMRFLSRYTILLVLFFAFASGLNAQNNAVSTSQQKDSILSKMTNIEMKVKEFATVDSISPEPTIHQIIDSVLMRFDRSMLDIQERDTSGIIKIPKDNWIPFDNTLTFADTILYNPAFLPVVFDGNMLPEDLDFLKKKGDFLSDRGRREVHLIDPDSTFAPRLEEARRVTEARSAYFAENPDRVKLNAFTFNKIQVIDDGLVQQENPLTNLIRAEDPIKISAPEVEGITLKPRHWLKEGYHSLKVSQNFMSSNWNGVGGDKNYNIENYHKFFTKYKRNKVTFENTFEWRLNMMRTPADNVRSISITDDFFRVYSTLSLESFVKNWSYTVNLEGKTPLFKSYPRNEKSRPRLDLLSPLEVNTGIGVKYNLEWKSKKDKFNTLKLSADLTPLSVQYRYVKSDTIDVALFGIEKGKKSKADIGTTLNVNLEYNFNKFTSVYSRLKYFTTYFADSNKVIAEWENRWDYNLNRYLAMSLSLYLRFDDGVKQEVKEKATWGYFQYNERLSFGLTYKW